MPWKGERAPAVSQSGSIRTAYAGTTLTWNDNDSATIIPCKTAVYQSRPHTSYIEY